MSNKIYLPISTNYVKHWGVWEAIREILQNAIDTGDFKQSTSPGFEGHEWQVSSFAGPIPKSALLMGESTKTGDDTSIGQYGEGFKLALLVLLRLNKVVEIRNGNDWWQPSIENHPELDVPCLCIAIHEGYFNGNEDNVTFVVRYLTDAEVFKVQNNYLPENSIPADNIVAKNGDAIIFEKPDCWETNKLFVKGLFVCNVSSDQGEFSYSFPPNQIQLDRDRNKVADYELRWEANRVLTTSGSPELLVDQAIKRRFKGNYVSMKYLQPADAQKATQKVAAKKFTELHGARAFPIKSSTSNAKKNFLNQQAVKVGVTPVTVNDDFYEMLPKNFNSELIEEVPELTETVGTRLTSFLADHGRSLKTRAKQELQLITNQVIIKGL